MSENALLLIGKDDVVRSLEGLERETIQTIKDAYCLHDQGKTSLPHSTFLRFPGNAANRIIALPAYLAGSEPVAGIKWISSFPNNIGEGLPRASAVIILNSSETGFPLAVIEGSLISAYRTAASAALACSYLTPHPNSIGIVGSGVISFEILRFIASQNTLPDFTVKVFDLNAAQAEKFISRCLAEIGPMQIEKSLELSELIECEVIVFATTSAQAHVGADFRFRPGSTLLHISLRDLAPELILHHRNIVDDIDHVNREGTSIHLAGKMAGNLTFITGTIGDVIFGRVRVRASKDDVVIFSPFGLGILDIALGQMVFERARDLGLGQHITTFY